MPRKGKKRRIDDEDENDDDANFAYTSLTVPPSRERPPRRMCTQKSKQENHEKPPQKQKQNSQNSKKNQNKNIFKNPLQPQKFLQPLPKPLPRIFSAFRIFMKQIPTDLNKILILPPTEIVDLTVDGDDEEEELKPRPKTEEDIRFEKGQQAKALFDAIKDENGWTDDDFFKFLRNGGVPDDDHPVPVPESENNDAGPSNSMQMEVDRIDDDAGPSEAVQKEAVAINENAGPIIQEDEMVIDNDAGTDEAVQDESVVISDDEEVENPLSLASIRRRRASSHSEVVHHFLDHEEMELYPPSPPLAARPFIGLPQFTHRTQS